jgi:hypothetical protein
MTNPWEDIAFLSYLSLHSLWYQSSYPEVSINEINSSYIQYDFVNRLTDRQRAEYAARADQPPPLDPGSILPPPVVLRARDLLDGPTRTSPEVRMNDVEQFHHSPSVSNDDGFDNRPGPSSSRRSRSRGHGSLSSGPSISRTPIRRSRNNHSFSSSHRNQLARSNSLGFGHIPRGPRGQPSRYALPRRPSTPRIMRLPQETRDQISNLTTEAIAEYFIGEIHHLENAGSMEAHLRTFHRNPLLHVPGLTHSITEIQNRPYAIAQRLCGFARPTIYIRVEGDALSWHNNVWRGLSGARKNNERLVNRWNASYSI